MFRHGDVYLLPVTGKPNKAKRLPRTARGVVLAEGEQTGHAHAIKDAEVWLWEADGRRYLQVPNRPSLGSLNGAVLDHAEHGAMAIAPGFYSVILQREYHPDAIRQVVD